MMLVYPDSDSFSRFQYGIKSDATKQKYVKRLELFFDFYKIEGDTIRQKSGNFLKLIKNGKNTQKLTDLIINYMSYHLNRVEKKEISRSTVRNYYKPIKLFCDMNNIILNWKIISKGLPSGPENSNDRIPTSDEIIELLKYPDRRIKPITYTMISSGIRVGAWDWLKWKHIIPSYDENNQVIAAKIIVYDGEPEQYFSFITPEAYNSLRDWMEFREKQGEKITRESWVMRDIWNSARIITNVKELNLKGTSGLISVPKKADSNAIRQIFTRSWKIQNIREVDNKRRHDFKSTHCFRKYFETHALKSMKLLNVKMLMGHDTGLEKSYYKPSEKELLDDYLKVVDILTVNKQIKLESKVNELAEKQDEIELIKLKHEKEMEAMDQKLNKILSVINANPKLARIKPDVLKNRINV
jgi:integrase